MEMKELRWHVQIRRKAEERKKRLHFENVFFHALKSKKVWF